MSSNADLYGAPETRRRILMAAWALIEERGAGVRLVDVAERAGVSRQSVYLHFRDRAGLLVALVQFMDETLGVPDLMKNVSEAPTGEQALKRFIELRCTYARQVDSVARELEAAQYADTAVAAAWRDRMACRHATHRGIAQRIAAEGRLAEGWTAEAAGDLIYTLTMQSVWRELTRELGWSSQDYAEHLTRLLHRAFLAG